MEEIAVTAIRVEMDSEAQATLIADFSPAPFDAWLKRFGRRLKDKGFAFSEPVTDSGVRVYLNGQSGPAEVAIRESATEASGPL